MPTRTRHGGRRPSHGVSDHIQSSPAFGILHSPIARAAGIVACLVAAFTLGSGPAPAADPSPPAPLDYQLFIGLDVYVHAGDDIGRVRHITRGKADIDLGDKSRTFPLRRLRTQRFDHVAKVSANRVTIEDTRGECVVVELDESMYDVVIDQASQQLQAEQVKRQDEDTAAFYESMNNPEKNTAKELERARKEMNERAKLLMPRADTDLLSQDRFLDLEHQEAATDSATLKVSFDISAPRPIDDACVIVFALLRHPVDPRAAIHRVLMNRLPKIESRPVTIRMERTGLPRGCVIESLGVHVYVRGREISSNVARGRVDVTRAEAIQFLRLQHLNIQAGKSLRPALLADFLPADAATLVPAAQRERKAEVQIDAQGDVVAVTLGRAPTDANDVRITALIRAVPFLPALDHGEPIAADHNLLLRDFIP